MAITKTNRLNMTGGGVPVIVRLSQYDDDFTLIFELYSTDGTFTIPSGTTAEVRGTKSDGKGFSASATIDITNKKVTVTGDQQMTAVSGKNIFELTLWKSNKELNTANFILDVEPAALDRNTIVSESKIMELLDVTDRADEIIDAAETIESSAAQIAINTQNIAVIEEEIARIGSGFPDDAKIALLNCFAHVAWTDEHGENYYDALEAALYAGTYPKITAIFDAGLNVIYTDDTLDTLKQYLTVRYYEAEGSTAVIVPSTDYTLLGTLEEGSNTIRALYEGLSASFVVDNVVNFYNIWDWSLGDGRVQKIVGSVDLNQSDITKYPSKATIRTDVTTRRNFNTTRGILPYYLYNQTAVSSGCYPIPVPEDANHMKITLTPNTQFINAQVFAYNSSNNTYNNSYSQNRIGWAAGLGGGEIDIARPNNERSMFLVINTKYNDAGTSYPTEPTALTIKFSEV